MERKEFHLGRQPIPEGFRLYEERLAVAGLHYRRNDAAAFCRASEKWLEFIREPDNPHDPNAIQVLGCWRGWFSPKKRLLGYVPREIAERIVQARLAVVVKPRLLKTYVGFQNYVEVLFQIIGPRDRYAEYKPSKNS